MRDYTKDFLERLETATPTGSQAVIQNILTHEEAPGAGMSKTPYGRPPEGESAQAAVKKILRKHLR